MQVAEFISKSKVPGADKEMTKTEIKYIVMSYVRSGDWETTVVSPCWSSSTCYSATQPAGRHAAPIPSPRGRPSHNHNRRQMASL